MNVQFKKGILEVCVLVLLSRKDYYGYELVETVSQNIDISEGAVYPILRRLTEEGYFTTYIQESNEGPARKYYKITELGRHHKDTLLSDWRTFVAGVTELIGKE
jgi:PadR family transcriptional regulator PadR